MSTGHGQNVLPLPSVSVDISVTVVLFTPYMKSYDILFVFHDPEDGCHNRYQFTNSNSFLATFCFSLNSIYFASCALCLLYPHSFSKCQVTPENHTGHTYVEAQNLESSVKIMNSTIF